MAKNWAMIPALNSAFPTSASPVARPIAERSQEPALPSDEVSLGAPLPPPVPEAAGAAPPPPTAGAAAPPPAQSKVPSTLTMEPENAALPAAGAKELTSWKDTLATVDRFKASVLVVGFGSKAQYKDPEAAQRELDKIADQFDAEHGKGKWLAVFGGDPYKAEAPDVACMIKYLQDHRSVPVLALQSDKVKEWGGVDPHLDYVHYLPTTTGPDGKIVWGGFLDGKPAGPTAGYLGEDFIGGKNPRLKAMVAIGGGEIAGQEAGYARQHGVPLHYIRAEARFDTPGGKYGAIDGMLGGL